ncbi:WAT1-related protein At3g28050-like [Impatiens glandulifera]|uniref:WAT1-related protein At3g28050-like n=1 Tax=Impatiens glandulifera TaxID=253017 RepID=UPI001FB08C45|nr:WAT1-related protein At3g28050-like [Impatiens glandulifera]
MELKSCLAALMPYIAMILVECFDVGLTTISKAAMSNGLSHFIFVVYSNALAAALLLPPAFIFNRKTGPPLTLSLLCKFFLLSLIGITIMQNCVFTGINYSSPTLGSAMSNLVPVFTFLLAVTFRLEKIDLRSLRSQIKILGTLVSISGALVVTFYEGPAILSVSSHISDSNVLATETNWVLGGLFLATASFCLSVWNASQAAILKGYPSGMTIVAFYCLFGAIQCSIVSLIAERNNPSAWKLSGEIEYISVIYSAVFGGVVTYCIMTWCIYKKGPIFVASFKPVSIAIAAIFSYVFLGESLYLGSVIGAIFIVIGFYGVMWAGTTNEDNKKKEPYMFLK